MPSPSPDIYQDLNSALPELRAFLAEIAQLFELGFEPEAYQYVAISPQEKVLLDFLGGCPGLPHSNWGNDDAVRQEKLKDFICSDEFQAYASQLSSAGSVLDNTIGDHLEQGIQRHALPNWAEALAETLKSKLSPEIPFSVFICLQENTPATLTRMRTLLVHEWTHLLFFSNGIQFEQLLPDTPDAWLYNEGLATWIEARFATGEWDNTAWMAERLAHLQAKGSPASVTGYFEKGLWFAAHFGAVPAADWAEKLKNCAQRVAMGPV